MLQVVVALVLLGALALTIALWPRDDVPDEPDAVVVLGGGGAERAELGIELRERYGTVLVLSSSSRYYAARRGEDCDADDTICFEPDPPTTIGEARNVADLAADRGWDHVTVATSSFHTSRTRTVFEQCLGDDAVTVVGAPSPDGPAFVLRRELREALGLLASWTIERAC
jgi:uncharacterized SAM-binding protein YcdF (DUF218 family)